MFELPYWLINRRSILNNSITNHNAKQNIVLKRFQCQSNRSKRIVLAVLNNVYNELFIAFFYANIVGLKTNIGKSYTFPTEKR